MCTYNCTQDTENEGHKVQEKLGRAEDQIFKLRSEIVEVVRL